MRPTTTSRGLLAAFVIPESTADATWWANASCAGRLRLRFRLFFRLILDDWLSTFHWRRLVLDRLAFDPLLAVLPDLFLPDRDDFFEAVHERCSRLEALLAVGRGDGHE